MAKQNRKNPVNPVRGISVESTKSVVQDKSAAKSVKRSAVKGKSTKLLPGYMFFVRKRISGIANYFDDFGNYILCDSTECFGKCSSCRLWNTLRHADCVQLRRVFLKEVVSAGLPFSKIPLNSIVILLYVLWMGNVGNATLI